MTFFHKLCHNEDYTNSALREDCLNLLMDFPYLTEHVDFAIFMPSRPAYGIFRAIRCLHKAGVEKVAHGRLWAEMVGRDESDFIMASLERGSTADAIGQLVGEKDVDKGWQYGYCVLKWRVDNDIVF